MSATKRPKPLYQRGSYSLYRRAGRANLEIVWYDAERRRERSRSAGTGDVPDAKAALDRLYLTSDEGRHLCPTCGQPTTGRSALVTDAIADYLVLAEDKPSASAIRARLAHVVAYTVEHDPAARCDAVEEDWVERFRRWALDQPIVSPTGAERPRSPSTVENSVLQLAAVINAAHDRGDAQRKARFRPIPAKEVNATPIFRATIAQIAAMFRYCLHPDSPTDRMRARHLRERENLLKFLRAAVATWARPDAIMDISTAPERRQWLPAAGVLALNPHGRRQTRKYRATLPMPRQFAAHLDLATGYYIPTKSIRSAWDAMAAAIGMPGEGQAGTKLIRRSIAHEARRRLGEESWAQGQAFLGHHKASTSDIYALRDPANLGKALAVTEAIIDEIEALCPGAYRNLTALGGNVVAIGA